ncbi:MAG: hypothetical protein KTR31_07310 [Myxococcales bacterium]|nr:hypothetical protein [Myxococcales bacterium]
MVWLASFPRSGNTFARHVLWHCLSIRTACAYDGDDYVAERLGCEWVGRDERTSAEVRAAKGVAVMKTHRRENGADPAIYLVRDGRACLRSWAELRAEQRSIPVQDALEQLLAHTEGATGAWGANVLHWVRRPTTVVLPFTQLVAEPVEALATALGRVGVRARRTGRAAPSFEEVRERDPRFFSKGVGRAIDCPGFDGDSVNREAMSLCRRRGWTT